MNRVLLISKNSALVKIYHMAITSAFETELVVSKNLDEALLLLGNQNCVYDLIICPTFEDDTEIGALLYQYKLEQEKGFLLLFYGNKDYLLEEIGFVDTPKNINKILDQIQDLLNTKRIDTNNKITDLYPIGVNLLKEIKVPEFNIYYQFENETILVLNENQEIDLSMSDFYLLDIKTLFIKKEYVEEFMNSLSLELLDSLKHNDMTKLNSEQKININVEKASNGMRILAQKVFNDTSITNEMVEISNFCLKSIDEAIESVPSIFDLCELLTKNITGYLYSHSVMSNSIARYIISRLSWNTNEYKKIVDHVFFFGDLYLAPIFDKYPDLKNEEEALFSDFTTADEKIMVLEHAKMSAIMIEKFPGISKIVSKVVREHHGMCDGEGFAQKFLDDISPISKVVIVSEAFVELLLDKRNSELTKDEKMGIIEELFTLFNKDSYHVYIEIIADYIVKI